MNAYSYRLVGLALAGTMVALTGCRMLGMKPSPEGLNDVKSVGKAADEWKDSTAGVWRYNDAKKLDWEDAKKYCDGLADSTKKRWRLPSPAELQDARTIGISSTQNKAFGWVTLGNTWAAEWETNISEDIAGVFVNMEDGSKAGTLYDDLEYSTVCVRTDSQGNQWTDSKSQSWWYVNARMPFETAEVTCTELARRRHEAWRLPTLTELGEALADGIQTTKNKSFGRDYLTFTWTAEVAAILDSDDAYAVDLRNGKSHLIDVDEDLAVVCMAPGAAAAKTTARIP